MHAKSALAALAAALLLAAHSAAAQTYPTRPVTLIVPYAAGGATDIGMRALATATEKHFSQPFVIDNRTGAGGTLGPSQMATSAKPDGYTISQIPISVFRYPYMAKTTYDPVKDFTYIISLSGYTFGVVVRADARWKTFSELLAEAKANPGKISYGTPGAGTSLHLTMEQIAQQRGIVWTHVPFRGNAETNSALLGGHIDVVADATGWGELVNSGKFRLLVTWGAARTKNWPNVPTLKETGIDIISNSPFGLAGPAGMTPAVAKALHDAFKKGMDEPSYAAAMAKLDQEPFYLNTSDYQAFAKQQSIEQKQVIEALGLKAN